VGVGENPVESTNNKTLLPEKGVHSDEEAEETTDQANEESV
jgi:hypothetical protein